MRPALYFFLEKNNGNVWLVMQKAVPLHPLNEEQWLRSSTE